MLWHRNAVEGMTAYNAIAVLLKKCLNLISNFHVALASDRFKFDYFVFWKLPEYVRLDLVGKCSSCGSNYRVANISHTIVVSHVDVYVAELSVGHGIVALRLSIEAW